MEQIYNGDLIINHDFRKEPFFQPFKPVQVSMARCMVVFKYVQLPCFYDSHQEKKEALNTIYLMISETETLAI